MPLLVSLSDRGRVEPRRRVFAGFLQHSHRIRLIGRGGWRVGGRGARAGTHRVLCRFVRRVFVPLLARKRDSVRAMAKNANAGCRPPVYRALPRPTVTWRATQRQRTEPTAVTVIPVS